MNNIWPKSKPNLQIDNHGWFNHQKEFDEIFHKDIKNVCELGSWLGLSTRYILNNSPDCKVYAIDHWSDKIDDYGNGGLTDASSDNGIEKISSLWEQFLFNCWDYRDRLFPIRSYTKDGLTRLGELDIDMDIVYIDASHAYEDVYSDIELSIKNWPNALIIGDDYCWESVYRAVQDFANLHDYKVIVSESSLWKFIK